PVVHLPQARAVVSNIFSESILGFSYGRFGFRSSISFLSTISPLSHLQSCEFRQRKARCPAKPAKLPTLPRQSKYNSVEFRKSTPPPACPTDIRLHYSSQGKESPLPIRLTLLCADERQTYRDPALFVGERQRDRLSLPRASVRREDDLVGLGGVG